MFGPLPAKYRLILTVAATLVFVGLGAWLAASTSLPLVPSGGALAGALFGLAVAYALVHERRGNHLPRRSSR